VLGEKGPICPYSKATRDNIEVKSRALIKGFIIGDYSERFNEGIQDLSSRLAEEKLKYCGRI